MRAEDSRNAAVEGSGGATETASWRGCSACGSHFIYPVRWKETGAHRWTAALRCPECEWTGMRSLELGALESLADAVEAGTAALARDLRLLERANMAADVERFAGALRAGAVLPEDF